MIRVNRKTDYAIRVLLALAKERNDVVLPTSQIQEEMLIPKALSRRVVADLARGDFVITYPGRNGGLKLARPAERINLLQVVEFFEQNFAVSECIHKDGACPFEVDCPVQRRWSRLQKLIIAELESTTFDALAKESAILDDSTPFGVGNTGV